jgi:hypothetical protein
MIRSGDGLVRHAKTVKAKIMFFMSENVYHKLRKQREELQHQVRLKFELLDKRIRAAERIADFPC